MFPDMTFAVLSRDADFVADMTDLLRSREAVVFVASSFAEYDELQRQGLVVEMVIVDPVFRVT
jgi:hypothetical protein